MNNNKIIILTIFLLFANAIMVNHVFSISFEGAEEFFDSTVINSQPRIDKKRDELTPKTFYVADLNFWYFPVTNVTLPISGTEVANKNASGYVTVFKETVIIPITNFMKPTKLKSGEFYFINFVNLFQMTYRWHVEVNDPSISDSSTFNYLGAYFSGGGYFGFNEVVELKLGGYYYTTDLNMDDNYFKKGSHEKKNGGLIFSIRQPSTGIYGQTNVSDDENELVKSFESGIQLFLDDPTRKKEKVFKKNIFNLAFGGYRLGIPTANVDVGIEEYTNQYYFDINIERLEILKKQLYMTAKIKPQKDAGKKVYVNEGILGFEISLSGKKSMGDALYRPFVYLEGSYFRDTRLNYVSSKSNYWGFRASLGSEVVEKGMIGKSEFGVGYNSSYYLKRTLMTLDTFLFFLELVVG